MQSGRRDTSVKRYAIKFCFKLGKNAATEMWHKRFKEGRESVREDESCGRSKEVNGPELIGQWVRVRVTMLRF